MNLASLDLNLLVALEALLEEESVSHAGRRVGLSQPAMSHALKRLRGLLADPLLIRVGGRMQLTNRGEELRSPVRETLENVRNLLNGKRFDPKQSERTFRMLVADNAGDLIIPLLLRQLQEVAPKIRIHIEPIAKRGGDPSELAYSVDAVIACVPDIFPGFYRQRLFTDHDACAIRKGHPIVKRLSDPRAFLEAKHVAVIVQGQREDPVDTWLRHEGHKRNITLSVPSYLQALHVVARSDLVAVIPERLICASTLKVRATAVPLDVGNFTEYLLHPARTHTDPGCAWFRKVLKQVGDRLENGSCQKRSSTHNS